MSLTSDGGYYEGAANAFTQATEYQVIVLTDTAYANADLAEAAIAARYSGSDTDSQVFVYLDSTAGVAKAIYDANINDEASDLDQSVLATFSNITTLTGLAGGFNAADFTLA